MSPPLLASLRFYPCARTKAAKPGHRPPSPSSVFLDVVMLKMRGRELSLITSVKTALDRALNAHKLLEVLRGEGILATAQVAELEKELCDYIAALDARFSSLPR